MNLRVAGASFVVVVGLARDARAAGIALDLQSGRGTGMAAAVTAVVDDSSAIFYNPAGIAQGKILDAQIGDSLILPSFQFTSPGGASTSTQLAVSPPFQIYESGGLTDNLSIGVGVFTPFGLSLAWPPDWPGKSLIVKSSLQTYDFNPTVAYRFGPLRVGAGLQIVRAVVDLQKNVSTGAADVMSELGAATWGAGANVGAQLDAIPQYLSLGVAYRSAVKFDFDGEAHFSGNVPVELQGTLHDQRVTTSITTPDVLQFGAATRPTKELVFDLDFVWYRWSTFQSIDLNFPAQPSLNSTEPKTWSDTVNAHLGGEWTVNPSWVVRAGVLYDPSPSPATTILPDVPDSDRINLAVGGTYRTPSGFHFDLGYQMIILLRKTSSAAQLPGDYNGLVNVLGLTLGYRTPR